tara:strand:- start:661 stop:918 length:258 start_codon:yes stop_codon:yes gene_type:complete
MANLNGIAGDIVGQVTTSLLNRFNPFLDQLDGYRQVLKALKDGEITLDRVQIDADGSLRVLAPPPTVPSSVDACVQPPEDGNDAT